MRQNIDHKKPGKHCHNCTHLEYGQGDAGDPEGWICHARDYGTVTQETRHLNLLDDEKYRFRGKKCFEAK